MFFFFYLGIAIRHILYHTAGGKPPAARVRRSSTGGVSDGVDRDVDDSPHALGVLLAEPEKCDLSDRN